MKPLWSVAWAIWLLEHLTFGPAKESLCGDLMEEFQLGRSAMWCWRQVLSALAVEARGAICDLALPVIFAAGWSMLYPAWRLFGQSEFAHVIPAAWLMRGWPWPGLLELSYGMVPAWVFIWTGFPVYLLLRREAMRDVAGARLVQGLLSSNTVLMAATIGLLHHFGHPQPDLHSMTREDFYSAFHLFSVSLPIALSLLTALLFTLPRTPRLGKRERTARSREVTAGAVP